MEHIIAYKNGYGVENWNPATADGTTPGDVNDVFVMLVARLDTLKRTRFPFNFGWGDHFPWDNGSIFWRFSDNRKSFKMFNAGETALIGLEFSVSNGIQNVYKNGLNILSGPRSSPTSASGAFFFPDTLSSDSTWGSDWTLGELVVVRGNLYEDAREQMEGYLAQKWHLTKIMPISHPYLSPYPNFRLFDKNNDELTNFNFSRSEDNQSLLINFFPIESPNRFTFQLGEGFGKALMEWSANL